MRNPNQRCISHKKELESIRADWDEVYRNSQTKSPFLTFEYVNLWYDCFAAPDCVRVYRVEDANKTISIFPLVFGSLKGFRLISGLTNDHSFHGGPLVCAGQGSRFQELFVQILIETKSAWDVFQNSFAYSFSPFHELLPELLLNERNLKWQRWSQPTYVTRVDRPFEIFLRTGISPKERKNFRLFRNRLSKAGEYNVRHYKDFEALKHWQQFVLIEDSGWKGKAGSSICRLSRNYQRYYQGLIALLAQHRALHLYFLELNGEAIAGAFCYQEGSVLHYAKYGYNEKFSAFSPFSVLFMNIMEDLATRNQDIERLHMFPWDYGYKHRYANEDAFCSETTIYSKTLVGYAAYMLKKVKASVTGLMEHYRNKTPK